MRKIVLGITLLLLGLSSSAIGGVDIGLSIEDGSISQFHLAIGSFYHVPEKEMKVVVEKKIPDEEWPVVFFIARRAKVSPEKVIELRLGGKNWMQISLHYGINADAYYVPAERVSGPPYGKAYGHYKNKKRSNWNHITLSDTDIINFVNLRFLSEHYGYSADEIIKLRSSGKNFININDEVKKRSHEKKKKDVKVANEENDNPGQAKNKGKGKKK